MINEVDLKDEIKRYPSFIKAAIKKGDYAEAYALAKELETLKFVLEVK